MKSPSNNLKLFSLGTITIMLLLALAGCQANFNGEKTKKRPPETPTAVDKVIIYGKVDSIPLNEFKVVNLKTGKPQDKGGGQIAGMVVAIVPHSHPCSDSTGRSDAVRSRIEGFRIMKSSKNSGTYRGIYFDPHELDPCNTIFVAAYDSGRTDQELLQYSRILAGPKKLGKDFGSHFHYHSPYDSVRIDFTVGDTTGN
jgi:hypothetical protein